MSQLIVSEPLASRIRALARQQKRPETELLAELVERYEPKGDLHHLPARPAESLTDTDIEVPSELIDISEQFAYRESVRKLRPKLYRIARRYWLKVGNMERLALTDEELDKAFWLIDHEGIPRFKSEKDSVDLPQDPLESLANLFDQSSVTDASTSVRETMMRKYDRPD